LLELRRGAVFIGGRRNKLHGLRVRPNVRIWRGVMLLLILFRGDVPLRVGVCGVCSGHLLSVSRQQRVFKLCRGGLSGLDRGHRVLGMCSGQVLRDGGPQRGYGHVRGGPVRCGVGHGLLGVCGR